MGVKLLGKTARWMATILGLIFLISALSKAYDLREFWIQIRAYGVVTDPSLLWASVLAVVVVELLLGLSLTFRIGLKSWTFMAVIALLLGFTSLVLYGWLVVGVEDCGCLGALASMSPGASLLKNAVLLALCIVAWKDGKAPDTPESAAHPQRFSLYGKSAGVLLTIGLFCAMAVYGLTGGNVTSLETTKTKSPPNADAHPLASYVLERDGRQFDLSQGEYLVSLLSMDCTHCGEAIESLNELQILLGDTIRLVGLCLGDEDSLDTFQFTYEPGFELFLLDPLEFFSFIEDPPRFVYLRNGVSMGQWDDDVPTIDALAASPDPLTPDRPEGAT